MQTLEYEPGSRYDPEGYPLAEWQWEDVSSGGEFNDEDLLILSNNIARQIGFDIDRLSEIDQEIDARGLLEPTPEYLISERSDDWLADRRVELKKLSSAYKKQAEAVEEEVSEIEEEWRRRFTERGSSGTTTSKYTVTISQDDHYPEITDREDLDGYILSTKKLHLLQKRLSLTAAREELDAMQNEKEAWIEKLDEQGWTPDVCANCFSELGLNDVGLKIFFNQGRLEEFVRNQLDAHFSIPGLGITTKLTLHQSKRGKK
jgi:hypothetical protein